MQICAAFGKHIPNVCLFKSYIANFKTSRIFHEVYSKTRESKIKQQSKIELCINKLVQKYVYVLSKNNIIY